MKTWAVDVEGDERIGKQTMVVGAENKGEAQLAALVSYNQRAKEAEENDAKEEEATT